jgi:hypothetical protein
MIFLRFRDIGVNDGESVRLHSAIAEKRHFAWWGWIRREGHEICPWELLVQQSRQLVDGAVRIGFVHTGTNAFYTAELSIIHAHPKGEPLVAPELGRTPRYMHERKCAAWFGIRDFRPEPDLQVKRVCACPTLLEPQEADKKLLRLTPVPASEFGHGSSTLWDVEL